MSQTFNVQVRKIYDRHSENAEYISVIPVTIVDGSNITEESAKACIQQFLASINHVRKNELQGVIFEKAPMHIVLEENHFWLDGKRVRTICTSKSSKYMGMPYVETADYVLHLCDDLTIVTNN